MLEEVEFLGGGVISDAIFHHCTSLKRVVLPSEIKTIGDYAFENCKNLTEVVVPQGVTEIGERAFALCDALTAVYYCGSIEEWEGVVRKDDIPAELLYFYSETAPESEGNYWRTVDGVPTPW